MPEGFTFDAESAARIGRVVRQVEGAPIDRRPRTDGRPPVISASSPEILRVAAGVQADVNGLYAAELLSYDPSGGMPPTSTDWASCWVFVAGGGSIDTRTAAYVMARRLGPNPTDGKLLYAVMGACPDRVVWDPVTGTFQVQDCNGKVKSSMPGCCGPCCDPMPAKICGIICSSTDPNFLAGTLFELDQYTIQPPAINPADCFGAQSGSKDTGCTPSPETVWAGGVPTSGPPSILVLSNKACGVSFLSSSKHLNVSVVCCAGLLPTYLQVTFTVVSLAGPCTGCAPAGYSIAVPLQFNPSMGTGPNTSLQNCVIGPGWEPPNGFILPPNRLFGDPLKEMCIPACVSLSCQAGLLSLALSGQGGIIPSYVADCSPFADQTSTFGSPCAVTMRTQLGNLDSNGLLQLWLLNQLIDGFRSSAAIPNHCCAPFDSGRITLQTPGGQIVVELQDCSGGSGSGGVSSNCVANLCISVNGIAGYSGSHSPNGNVTLPFVGVTANGGVCVYGNATISGDTVTGTANGWYATTGTGRPGNIALYWYDSLGVGACSMTYSLSGWNGAFPATVSRVGGSSGATGCGSNWPGTIVVNSC
jgi:hypothetical protein